MNTNDITRKDLGELVALTSYLNEIKKDLPAPYKEYSLYWEEFARNLMYKSIDPDNPPL
jgi:hypothetical protein